MSEFFYFQQVPIEFGAGKLQRLPDIIRARAWRKGLLITTKSIAANGTAERVVKESGGLITDFTYGIQPNPTVQNTSDCIEMLCNGEYDFAVALGGGSVLDCAKAAAALAPAAATAQQFFSGDFVLTEPGLPLIAVPTTAGTASEITRVSVISDPVTGRKRPFNSPFLYPAYALIDPLLTISCNKKVTAASGIDVLAHSLEALYSQHHQPFTDLFAKHAAALVFRYLQTAYDEPENIEARTKMAEASVAAGMAFNLTQTAVAHACSYPLTEMLGIPHGEACAFTLPKFWLLNAQDEAEGPRLQDISRELGFRDAAHLAERTEELKQHLELRTSWKEIGVETDEQLQQIIEASFAPNIYNNPVTLTKESLYAFFNRI